MKIENSESTKRVYPMKQILKATGLFSAAFYRKKPAGNEKARPGSKPGISDEVLLVEIREILKCIFVDEGCEKIWKRLKRRGVRASKDRINRVTRENNLLSVDEIMAWHICKIGDRFAAMEPLKMADKKTYGTLDRDICQGAGLFLRSDHGSQYDSNDFQKELSFLGLIYSPAFVRSPGCNGIIERFHRNLGEQVLNNQDFESLEQARPVIAKFIEDYNREWLIHRLGLTSPLDYREDYERIENDAA